MQTTLTTPEAPDLHGLFAMMRERGVEACAMEVSSHALVMGRVDGVVFDVAVFLNLGRDHLDFHADVEDYYRAKASLFTPERARLALVERRRRARPPAGGGGDDPGPHVLAPTGHATPTGGPRTSSCAPTARRSRSSRPTARRLAGRAARSRVTSTSPTRSPRSPPRARPGWTPRPSPPGSPAAAAYPAAWSGSTPARTSWSSSTTRTSRTPSRPRSRTLRPLTDGRLIVVLGAGGDRDPGKRPIMAGIAARLADLLVVTDDNPRTEDPAAIRAAMLAGVDDGGEAIEIGDRREAIREAIRRARPGDIVLVAGKGHETGQEIDGVVHPFDDREVVREELACSR